jgi:hypothetical protein
MREENMDAEGAEVTQKTQKRKKDFRKDFCKVLEEFFIGRIQARSATLINRGRGGRDVLAS